ncbi:hypothetical protein D3C77_376860 [compost metagenome]
MEFVDDDGVQRSQQPARICRTAKKECLDRFRRDHHHATGGLQHPSLRALRRVAVPTDQVHSEPLAQKVQASMLIVDQGLERRDIKNGDARLLTVGRLGEQRQEGRLRLAGGGRRRDHDVPVVSEDFLNSLILDRPQFAPAFVADPAADFRM